MISNRHQRRTRVRGSRFPRSGAILVDESNTSLLFLGLIGASLGIGGGLVAFFFGRVLWDSLEEVPDDAEGDDDEVMA